MSPSTVTGIEVSGEDQPFGQNAYSRTSQQTYRDVAGVAQDTWTIGSNKVNEFRFQYARRGLSYFYNTAIPGGSDPAVNIPGYAYFGREPYSYIQRVEQRYQFTDNFSWTIGRHNTKFGVDFNYLPLPPPSPSTTAASTISAPSAPPAWDLRTPPACPVSPTCRPYNPTAQDLPGDFVQGIGSPTDSFHNIPIGVFWQDSWRLSPTVTLNYGLRYDVEIPPTFPPPQGLALSPPTTSSDCKKAFRPTRTIFSHALASPGIPAVTARASYALPTACFMTIRCSAFTFSARPPTVRPAVSWHLRERAVCSGPGNPGNLNAITIFQGLPINQASAANPCARISESHHGHRRLDFCPTSSSFSRRTSPVRSFSTRII